MRILTLLALVLVGCRNPEPTALAEAPSASSSASSTIASPTPKKIRVKDHDLAFLDAEDTPGFLVDSNAPPPPPGSPPAKHPFLTASCYGGKPELCSKARDLLLASKSWEDFVGRLRGAGFVVEPR